jgi:hypothetical protein
MLFTTIFIRPFNYLLRDDTARARSPHTSLKGLGKLYRDGVPVLRAKVLVNLITRVANGRTPIEELVGAALRDPRHIQPLVLEYLARDMRVCRQAIAVLEPLLVDGKKENFGDLSGGPAFAYPNRCAARIFLILLSKRCPVVRPQVDKLLDLAPPAEGRY